MITKNKKIALFSTMVMASLLLPLAAFAANKLVVMDAAGTTPEMVVTDTGYIGVGTNAPLGPIHVVSSGNLLNSAGFTVQHTSTVVNGIAPPISIAPNFSLFRNNDVTLNAGLPRDGDSLGFFGFGSIITGTQTLRAILFSKTERAWTATDNPTYFQFMTNPGSNVGNREMLRLSGSTAIATVNGGLRLYPYTGTGSTTPVGTGATPPTKPVCDATTQGTLWFTKNASAKDLLEICANGDATGVNYAWRSIAF